jgi:TolB-like protein/class 3 adenylate cyclase/Tfp pilus assembly protein PilF
MSEEEIRKLAAIMFTDMVGYSALSQRNDRLAQELLEEHRELLREIFPRFHGTEIKTIGDAFLVEFNSALEAAQCAIEIQRSLAHRNADAPAGRQIQVKIGIHIGDVVHRGGDVYGDGVNIASRIEPLAGAGGICISMDVERQIRNAVETRLEKLVPTELKNISVPMDLFRIVLPWEKQSALSSPPRTISKSGSNKKAWIIAAVILLLISAIGWWWRTRSHNNLTLPTKQTSQPSSILDKSIAVLPFDNLSDDKSNAYFAEGIQDEILTRLSKIGALKVISRTSTQKYKSAPDNLREVGQQLGVATLLEGSVQKAGNAVHINVQLIKAATDEHLWAESYDRELQNIFGVEGEVASAIAEQLKAKLSGAEQKALADKPTENLAAYDDYLRALAIEASRTDENASVEAAALYDKATQLDPRFAIAWARLAIVRSYLYFFGFNLAQNSAAAIKGAAEKALALQPDLGEGMVAQGVYYYRVLRNFSKARECHERALKLLPNSSLVLEQLALVERRLGLWTEAEEHFRKATELDPRNIEVLSNLADTFYSLRKFREARATADRILQISPGNEGALVTKIRAFQDEGRLTDAAETIDKLPTNSREVFSWVVRGTQLTFERRFEEEINLIRNCGLSSFRDDPRTAVYLGWLQLFANHKEEARATFARAIGLLKPTPDAVVPVDSRDFPSFLALAYAGLGEKDKALAEARSAVADYKDDSLDGPFTEQTLAQIEAYFGDADSAIAALPHQFEVPNGLTPALLRFDPFWDPLRKEPRFQKLCEKPNE